MADKRSADSQRWRWVYKDKRWRGEHGIRAQRLAMEPLCRMCATIDRTVAADTVDHIKDHKGDPALAFDIENTQSLCHQCHSGEKQRMTKRGYSSAVGEDGWPIDPAHPANRTNR